jgi:hypothetical protein
MGGTLSCAALPRQEAMTVTAGTFHAARALP